MPSGSQHILVFGGTNREVFTKAVRGEYGNTYLRHVPEWYRFNRTLYVFDTQAQQWRVVGDYAPLARAGAALVAASSNVFYCIGGH